MCSNVVLKILVVVRFSLITQAIDVQCYKFHTNSFDSLRAS